MFFSFNKKRTSIDEIKNSKDDISKYCSISKNYFDEKEKVVSKLADNEQIKEFLRSCNKDTFTIEHNEYNEVISILKKVKEESREIYLAFIGINCNGDVIDNNGRSRQNECKERKQDPFIVSEKQWYIEIVRNGVKNKPTVTMPYRDTSGSYVISIAKEVVDENGAHLGVIGIDVLARNIALKLESCSHIIMITNTGEIVYNSDSYIRDILELQCNIALLLDPETLDCIKRNKFGHKYSRIYDKDCLIAYGELIHDKYYIVGIYK